MCSFSLFRDQSGQYVRYRSNYRTVYTTAHKSIDSSIQGKNHPLFYSELHIYRINVRVMAGFMDQERVDGMARDPSSKPVSAFRMQRRCG
jgi:hypothetical protein